MKIKTSESLYERSKKVIPGGVNSPVRSFRSVGGVPRFMAKGQGSKVVDVDGNTYIDYVGSWGPFILGHSYYRVVEKVAEVLKSVGMSFGAPTEMEVQLAEMVSSFYPCAEMVRLVSSGTEATMSAVRAARGFSKREKIIKFEGCYHGHSDAFLIKAGSGALTLGSTDSGGVTQGSIQDTLVAKYNNIDSVQNLFRTYPDQIAAIIIEPIAGNMGVVPTAKEFLHQLRDICTQYGAILIFDEVMTGFRVGIGGAMSLYDIQPDMVTLGKILGGGLPLAAYCGRQDIMSIVSPVGDVYQAGTLSGNPLTVAAGIETLCVLKEGNAYTSLEKKSLMLEQGIEAIQKKQGSSFTVNRVGSMLTIFFTQYPVVDLNSAKKSSLSAYSDFFHGLLSRGIYFPPSQFESVFISTAHTEEDIDKTLNAIEQSLVSATYKFELNKKK